MLQLRSYLIIFARLWSIKRFNIYRHLFEINRFLTYVDIAEFETTVG